MPQVCDYQGTDYQKDFWQSSNRRYEEAAEKAALRKFLPVQGESIVDLGAGFGRLADVYAPRFQKVILFDYAQNLLDQARDQLPKILEPADFAKIEFQQGDIYKLPFPDKSFSAAICFRVAHHLEDLPAALREVHRILRPGGVFIFEFANKRNVLEICRWLLRWPNARPFDRAPFQRSKLYFNFHPRYVLEEINRAGFSVKDCLSLSNFRLPLVKKILPWQALVGLDRLTMGWLGKIFFGPSIILVCQA